MKRRAPRRQTNGKTVLHAHPVNHSRAIVLVDGTGIRNTIKKGYEKALRDLETSRRQLDQFHQTDLPQFTRWLNTHFGAMLTELRERSQQLAADEALIFQVEGEVMFGGGSHARAYQRVMEFRDNPEPLPPPPSGGAERDGEWDPFGTRPGAGDFDGEEDPVEEIFKELFGEFGPGERPRNHRGPRAGQHAGYTAPGHKATRLKELYRTLVRRLHPDSQREMTAQKTEWWHQAQAAYEAGDAEQLEVILTLCDIGDSGTTAHTSASLLQRITAQLNSSLREIKRQLAGRRRDPAWHFSLRADHDALAAQMRRDLQEDLRRMRYQCRQTQELIARWKAAAERLKQPRRRKRHPQSAEFLF
jgi:hypothetical protein